MGILGGLSEAEARIAELEAEVESLRAALAIEEQEMDQAAPVLAAALAWRGTKSYSAAVHLDHMIAAWRAAREG